MRKQSTRSQFASLSTLIIPPQIRHFRPAFFSIGLNPQSRQTKNFGFVRHFLDITRSCRAFDFNFTDSHLRGVAARGFMRQPFFRRSVGMSACRWLVEIWRAEPDNRTERFGKKFQQPIYTKGSCFGLMRHQKMISLDEKCLQIAQNIPNFSQWVRGKLMELDEQRTALIEQKPTVIYSCDECNQVWVRRENQIDRFFYCPNYLSSKGDCENKSTLSGEIHEALSC